MDRIFGPGLIGLAALLWATDGPFRYRLGEVLDPARIVFFEHLAGLAALSAWVYFKTGRKALKLSAVEWLCVALIGIGGSALATFFFTASFRYVNPSVAILLQKLQPIFVVLLAFVALGERPAPRFFGWATVALAAAGMLSVGHFDLHGAIVETLAFDPTERGVIYALLAAALWAGATVAGKVALRKQPPAVVTFWRYFFAAATLGLLVICSDRAGPPVAALGSKAVWLSLLYMSLISGLVPMVFYYVGLSRTPASVATFVELVYPISAIAMNTWFLATPLTPMQLAAAAILLAAVFQISR